MSRKTALVIAPGRGTYNKEELGYFARHHAGRSALLARFDAERQRLGQERLADLDGAERYSVSRFTRGDNASALIHACALADFLSIDRERYDVVAVTGNSMGWYIALACAGALGEAGGFKVVNTMGLLMQEALIGDQLLYPFVDENWVEVPGRRSELLALADEIPGLHLSIDLGGMIVFGGEAAALEAAEARLEPVQGRFPMRLANHAAFHTPLQAPVSAKGLAALGPELFGQPEIPLIDGRGHAWLPHASNVGALRDYTLGTQVFEPYSLHHRHTERAQGNCARRRHTARARHDTWRRRRPGDDRHQLARASSRQDFAAVPAQEPYLISMGMDGQRELVAAA